MSKHHSCPPGKIIESVFTEVEKENGGKETKGVVSSTQNKGKRKPSEKDSEVVII